MNGFKSYQVIIYHYLKSGKVTKYKDNDAYKAEIHFRDLRTISNYSRKILALCPSFL